MSDAIYDGLHLGDCFEVMKRIPDGSVDMVLADLPYGTTACKWDAVLPFEQLWSEYWRVAKPNAAIVLTASQPFTSTLVMSQPKKFRYCWVWDKVNLNTGALLANKMPMKRHEDIAVFYKKMPAYNPQFENVEPIRGGHRGRHAETVGFAERGIDVRREKKTPCSVIAIKGMEPGKIHPTQKPVALFEYLMRTYTDEGMTVLDNTAGSGTTAIAAINAKRNWICIERDPEYFAKAKARIEDHINKMELF